MKNILFTNVQYVIVSGVRMSCHALLLKESKPIFADEDDDEARRYQAVGFGTEAAWNVFDMDLPSMEYTSEGAASPHIMMTEEDGPVPLSSGIIITIKDGPKISIVSCDNHHPIDIQEFERADDVQNEEIIDTIYKKATHYWRAPNMPSLVWTQPHQREEIRRTLHPSR